MHCDVIIPHQEYVQEVFFFFFFFFFFSLEPHAIKAPKPAMRLALRLEKAAKVVLKGNSHQKISVANIIELLLKSFLVYHSPMFKAQKVPKRPVEVSCDVTQHLVAYRTAVETRTNSSGMRTHTGQHSRLACIHAPIFAWLVVRSVQKSCQN